MAPDLLKVPNLIQAFYLANEDFRLNSQGEALMKLVELDSQETTPQELIYRVDDCIELNSEPFRAISEIIAQMLAFFLSPVCDGLRVSHTPGKISYHPLNIDPQVIQRLANLN